MIFNIVSFRCLARKPFTARRWFDRLRGMIGQDFSSDMDCMVFHRCGAVHSCFMSRKIDVVFVDRESKVVALKSDFAPWRCFSGGGKAVTALEFPPGTIQASGTKIGDRLNLNMELDPETVEKLNYGAILYPENADAKRQVEK